MKDLRIIGDTFRFTSGRKRYCLTVTFSEVGFYVEEIKPGILVTNESSKKMEKKLKAL